jgi:CheY-like chemotaxis protein
MRERILDLEAFPIMSRTLVLDDERDAGVSIQRALEGEGREVSASTDEEEAISKSMSKRAGSTWRQ